MKGSFAFNWRRVNGKREQSRCEPTMLSTYSVVLLSKFAMSIATALFYRFFITFADCTDRHVMNCYDK